MMTWHPDEKISSLANELIQRRRRACSEQFREQDIAIARRHSVSRTLFTPQVFAELRTALRAALADLAKGMTGDLVDLIREPDGNIPPGAATWIAEQLDPVLAVESESLVNNMSGGPSHREALKVDLTSEARAALDDARRDLKIALARATLRPRRRASVHTTGRASWSEATPPQARPKSPVSRHLRSTVDGEWSETTRSSTPSRSPFHSNSRFADSRIGGQHLYGVAPSGISSAANAR